MHQDSAAWKIYAHASFGLSLAMLLVGVWITPGELWMKAYFMMGIFFLTGSCFTLAKTLRDEHEAATLSGRLETARAEKILKDYETAA